MSITFGYCKNCISYIKSTCNRDREILSASPMKPCNFKKEYEMLPVDKNVELVGNTFKWSGREYRIEDISYNTSSLVDIGSYNNSLILMDLDLVYNLYQYYHNNHPLILIKKDELDVDNNSIKILDTSHLVSKKLNVNKIKDIEDVKAVLEILDIKFNNIEPNSPIIKKIGHLLDDM